MKTDEILLHISGNGGFNNWRHWNKKEIAVWVRSTFRCLRYVGNRGADCFVKTQCRKAPLTTTYYLFLLKEI